jgi:FkbM family methyltransferase
LRLRMLGRAALNRSSRLHGVCRRGKNALWGEALIRSLIDQMKGTALYRRFEWTPLHRLFVRLNNPAYEASQRIDMEFYSHVIRNGDLVFDIGANHGSKVEVFLRPGARVIAVEPDPRCCRILRQRFSFSRRFKLVPMAVGGASGRIELFVEHAGSAYNTASRKWRDHSHAQNAPSLEVAVATLDQLIRAHGRPAFLKIDVEGFEREVLRQCNVAVRALSFEANLPLFREETLECIDLLSSLNARYRFALVSSFAVGWGEPRLTAAEAIGRVEQADGCCEVFAIDPG